MRVAGFDIYMLYEVICIIDNNRYISFALLKPDEAEHYATLAWSR